MSRRGHTFLNTRNDGLWKSDSSGSEKECNVNISFNEAKFLISYASQLFTSQLFPHTWCSIVMFL